MKPQDEQILNEIIDELGLFFSHSIEEDIKQIADMYYKKQLLLHNVVGQSEQLANFCKKISKQEDCPAEFQEIVNKEFWNLIG